MHRPSVLSIVVIGVIAWHMTCPIELIAQAPSSPVAEMGSRIEPFMDDWLIERMTGTALRLHHPVPREIVLRFDAAWEGAASAYVGAFADGNRYRMYYRGCTEGAKGHQVTCYAESTNGIDWTRPELGLCDFNGSRRNNIILIGEGTHNFAAFKDLNPDAPDGERYKAVATGKHDGKSALIAFVSPDGLNFTKMQADPIITRGAFDSQNTAQWDAYRQQYVAFVRDFRNGVRSIRTCTSNNFRDWTEPVWVNFSQADDEHLYTNAALPYFRAPHIYIAMPMRYQPDRRFIKDHPDPGAADGVFLTSRDGVNWDRRFCEAFIRPGPDVGNWTDRANMPAWAILATSPEEISVYWTEHYRADDPRLRRGTLRTDGFVSVNAPYAGGEFTTKPLVFKGTRLILNYATSAVGSIRIEIQNPAGEPVAGYALADATELYGDEIARTYAWKTGQDVSKLAGKPIRLRVVMKDADLYAIQFRP